MNTPAAQLNADDRDDLLIRLLIGWASDETGYPIPRRRGQLGAALAMALRDEIESEGNPRCPARVVGLLASCIQSISEMAIEDAAALGALTLRALADGQ